HAESWALAAPDPALRLAALHCAGAGSLAKEELQRALTDSDPRVRREAVLALARSGDSLLRFQLFGMARSDDSGLRAIAVEALGIEGSPDATRLLQEVLEAQDGQDSHDGSLVAAAARGLARLP